MRYGRDGKGREDEDMGRKQRRDGRRRYFTLEKGISIKGKEGGYGNLGRRDTQVGGDKREIAL